MKRPIIGVMPLWDDEKQSMWMLPGYFDAVEKAGGIPVMLPLTIEEQIMVQCIDMCDGFLFTGGHDVSPEIYGCRALAENVVCCPERDIMESFILQKALESDMPVLGICRGIQFINAYLGGTLYQDIPAEHPSAVEHHQLPPYDVPVHKDHIIEDSPLYELLHKKEINVNSYHHQAVNILAPELKAMAESEDGLIEAVYMPEKRYVWAVQWHPEFSFKSDEDSMKIVMSFVDAAAAYY